MRPLAFFAAALAILSAGCGDDPTAPAHIRPDLAVGSDTTTGASITTDKDDYAPGDSVRIAGDRWAAGEAVHFHLTREPQTAADGEWDVEADEAGTFQSGFQVADSDLGVTFTLTATGPMSGSVVKTVFTDGATVLKSATFTPASPAAGASFSVQLEVDVNGSGGGRIWKGTQLWIDSGTKTCYNTADHVNANGTYVETVSGLTAPAAGSSHTLNAQLYETDNCTDPKAGGEKSFAFTLAVPAGPTKLAFTTTAVTGVVGQCLGPITVETRNASDAATNVTSATTVSLASDGTGAFFSDNACGTAATSVGIASGNNSATFYYKATAKGDGTHQLTASATGLTSANQTQTIEFAPANKLIFTSAAFGTTTHPVVVGQCSPQVTAQTQNADGAMNPASSVTVALTSTSTGGSFYSDAGCSSAITSVTIPTSGNSANLYYKDVKAGSPKITGAATGFTSAEQTETIGKGTPAFSNLASPKITYGDTPTTLSGEIAAGTLFPTGNVSITLNGVTQQAAIGTDGKFSSSFATGALGVAASPYTVTYKYAGGDDFNAVSPDGTGTLTVDKATPAFSDLSSPEIAYGQGPTAISGKVAKGSLYPSGSVTITLNGTSQQAAIDGSTGAFSASFATSALPVSGSPYTIAYQYGGDANFKAASDGAGALTVNQAATTTAIVSLSAAPYIVNGQVTVNLSLTPEYGGTPTGSVEVSDGAGTTCTAVLPATSCQLTFTTVGTKNLTATYGGDGNFKTSVSSPATTITVKYNFSGFFAPVDRPNMMNVSKAGQAIPLKWRLTDATGAPITSLSAVSVRAVGLSCSLATSLDQIEEYAANSSGLQNLGDGNYQFNWKTPATYANSCKSIALDFGAYVESPSAYFTFKK
jgi:hypothetical protein